MCTIFMCVKKDFYLHISNFYLYTYEIFNYKFSFYRKKKKKKTNKFKEIELIGADHSVIQNLKLDAVEIY